MSNYYYKRRLVAISYILLFIISVFLTYHFYNGMIDEENGANGNFSSPLDDTFIHLVYAENIANGNFFKYNIQDDYTTGNTSILYSFFISIFFLMGINGLDIIFVLFIFNAILLFLSSIFLFKLCYNIYGLLFAVLCSLLFTFNSHILWGYFTIMEVSLFSFLIIFLFYISLFLKNRRSYFFLLMVVSTLVILTRPEGLFVFIIIIIPVLKDNILFQNKKIKWINRNLYLLLIPLAFIFIQYITFYYLTGRFSANGMVQKSIFYNPTATLIQSIEWIATDFGKILKLMLGGFWFDSEISYVLFIPLFFIAFIGCISLIYNNKWSLLLQIIALFIGCVLTTMVLETRLWHFHRYQIPFFFPYIMLLVFGLLFTYKTIYYMLIAFFSIIRKRRNNYIKTLDERIDVQLRYIKIHLKDKMNSNLFVLKNNLLVKTIIAILILIPLAFYGYYSFNDISKDVLFFSEGCKSTYLQQIDMGNYINDNLPSTANVVVHDAGAIKYLSKSYITDIVGLCHNDFPIINRLGFLGVFERIKNLTFPKQPDYAAVFPRWYPFERYFLTKELVYSSEIDYHTMGGNDVTKTLFKLDLTYLNDSNYISDHRILRELKKSKMIDSIDIGDLIIQNKHDYNPNTVPDIVMRQFYFNNNTHINCFKNAFILEDFEEINSNIFDLQNSGFERITNVVLNKNYQSNIGFNLKSFISSYNSENKSNTATIASVPIFITKPNLFFLIAGNKDIDNLYVRGSSNDKEIFKVTGDKIDAFKPVNIDVSKCLNERMIIEVVDDSEDKKDYIAVDCFALSEEPIVDYSPCQVCFDGGQIVNHCEEFVTKSIPSKNLLIVGRYILPQDAVKINIFVNDIFSDSYRLQSNEETNEYIFTIPGSKITSDNTKIKIEFVDAKQIESYHIWIFSK